MTVDGIDISNHQPRWRPGAEKFVYILATDGHSWYSPTHANQVRLARDDGKRVGHYHWLRPGNIQEQVDWFWAHAKPLPGDALICDWEQSGTSNADKDEFLKQLDAKIPRTKLLRKRRMPRALYCNRNYWLNYDRTGFVGEGLWIAEYGVAKPGITYPWTFWQFADGPTTDRNHSIFQTLTEYDDWAEPSDGSQPHPAPVTDFVPVPPTLGAIHTPYGAWGPSWSWNRGKNSAHPTWGQHGGDDWHRGAGSAEVGDPIVAVASGKILFAGDARKTGAGWGSAFGIHVLNKWDDGGRTSIDAHMSRLAPGLKAGDHVTAGQVIGHKGATGNVNGPHDHHEQHLGTRWTDKRVKPIYPGKKIVTKGAGPTMALTKLHNGAIMAYPKSRNWHRLPVDGANPGRYFLAQGPGLIDLRAYIRASAPVEARFILADTRKGSWRVASEYPIKVIQPGGDEMSLLDTIGGAPAGWSSHLIYLQIRPSLAKVQITNLFVRAKKE
jgi:murein DD-endopeptidase MepM/ murein hydrolase activator NlpD